MGRATGPHSGGRESNLKVCLLRFRCVGRCARSVSALGREGRNHYGRFRNSPSQLRGSTLVSNALGPSRGVTDARNVRFCPRSFRPPLVGRRRHSALIVGFGGLVMVIICSFLVLYLWGIDLQRMSLGALVVAMSMIVDNAIVVLENIVRLREEKNETLENSATIGTRQVSGAIVASTLTTCVIFSFLGLYCNMQVWRIIILTGGRWQMNPVWLSASSLASSMVS